MYSLRINKQWHQLLALAESMNQTNWVCFRADFHKSSHVLVAHRGAGVLGFLRFVVQEIGADRELPLVTFRNHPLLEAKILAFGVCPAHRRVKIGSALQQQALEEAQRLGCYQVRSHSGGGSKANHALKLSMGFAVHPTLQDENDPHAVFFVKSLAQP